MGYLQDFGTLFDPSYRIVPDYLYAIGQAHQVLGCGIEFMHS